MVQASKVWLDGRVVDFAEANVHVLTHSLHYGLAVFEGIRCYETLDGRAAVFRLREHIRRLFDSAKICTLPMPYTEEEIVDACIQTVRANGFKACYLRPLAFLGDGAMGLGAVNPTRVAIAAWQWGAYLGDDGIRNGIRAKVSSFTRPGINMLMSKGKVSGHYVNSVLAKREALAGGYQESILLDAQGHVSEASGENVWMVRDGIVYTPSMGGSILGGITRDSIIHLLSELKIPLRERNISRDELYVADEIFLCGTAAEITPVRELDDRTIGKGARGLITERIQTRYFDLVRGKDVRQPEWLSYV